MPYPIDETKLQRVRELMKQQDLDALVVRAPDNIVYLTNYWCMKGYDIAVFPREGEADAHRHRAAGRRRAPHLVDARHPAVQGL